MLNTMHYIHALCFLSHTCPLYTSDAAEHRPRFIYGGAPSIIIKLVEFTVDHFDIAYDDSILFVSFVVFFYFYAATTHSWISEYVSGQRQMVLRDRLL